MTKPMDNYIWVFQKKDDRHLLWAFACSLALHFMLLAILVIKPFYPISGISEKPDSIWLYPALTVQGDLSAKVNVLPSAAGPEHIEGAKVPVKETAVQPPSEKRTVVAAENEQQPAEGISQEEPKPDLKIQAEPVTELVTAKVIKERVEKPVKKEKKEKKPVSMNPTEKLMDDKSGERVNQSKPVPDTANAEKVAEKKVESKKPENPVKEDVAKKLVAKADDGKVLAGSGESGVKSETPRAIQNAATSARQQLTQIARKDNNVGASQSLTRNSITMEVSRQAGEKSNNTGASEKKVTGNPVLPVKIVSELPFLKSIGNTGKSSGQPQVKPGAEQSQSLGTGKPERKESPGNAPPVAAQPKSKNEVNGINPSGQTKNGISTGNSKIALLPLTGDLKLEITGNTIPIISVSFTEYLKSHRNRPMTRAEARRIQIVKPVTRTVGEVVEAVVGTTGEGVYEFIVAPGNDNPLIAAFSVKIYENRSKAKTRKLGTKTVKGKVVIAQILMPEGIFWDDENNFSGYLEDSDSITKYNSENGLVWKEYKSPED